MHYLSLPSSTYATRYHGIITFLIVYLTLSPSMCLLMVMMNARNSNFAGLIFSGFNHRRFMSDGLFCHFWVIDYLFVVMKLLYRGWNLPNVNKTTSMLCYNLIVIICALIFKFLGQVLFDCNKYFMQFFLLFFISVTIVNVIFCL